MAFCTKCGTQFADGVQFCPSCGQQVSASQPNPGQQSVGNGASPTASNDKAFAIIAYFIFFVPLLAAPNSAFARYHANQGLILLIGYVALGIVNGILSAIFLAALAFGLWGVISVIFSLVYIALGVLGIIGIVNAAQNKTAPMPLIGNLITIIK